MSFGFYHHGVLALLKVLDGVCRRVRRSNVMCMYSGGRNGEHVTSKDPEHIVMYISRIRCSDDQCPMLLNVFQWRTSGTRSGDVMRNRLSSLRCTIRKYMNLACQGHEGRWRVDRERTHCLSSNYRKELQPPSTILNGSPYQVSEGKP